MDDAVEVIARAIKECVSEFNRPVPFYVEGEAKLRFERAHGSDATEDRSDDPNTDWAAESYEIIARAALSALEAAGYEVRRTLIEQTTWDE